MLGKAAKFLVEKLFTSEVVEQKPHGGVENTHLPPVLLGLKSESFLRYPVCHFYKSFKLLR